MGSLNIYAAGAAFSACEDRFVTKGYRKGLSYPEMIDEFAKIEGINGVAVMPSERRELELIRSKIEQYGMRVGVVGANTYLDAEQKTGTLSSRDPAVRKKSVEHIKQCMDLAEEFGAYDVLLWFAHDGFDYPFEDDYSVKWDWMMDGLAEAAEYNGRVKLTIEYKKEEPRTHQYINAVGTAVAVCEKLGKPNVGLTVDLGHSLAAGENPAWAVEFVHRFGRLFDVHVNDNYRHWDDDLLIGSIHFFETLEFFCALRRIGYDSWFDIDIWPSRVDGKEALAESVRRIYWFASLADRLYESKEFEALRARGETMQTQAYLRELLKNA